MLRSVDCYLVAGVLGHPTGPTFRDQGNAGEGIALPLKLGRIFCPENSLT